MTPPLLVFPQDIPSTATSTGVERYGGMELRDWFAGVAMSPLMQGMVASKKLETPSDFAKKAYQIADAMLKARSNV